jgi:hypothetical protein
MKQLVLLGADLVAVCILVFGLYVPRHHRRDLIAAFLGVNVGVLAVAQAMSTSSVGSGLGLGLFAVLSIIRLRSTELEQHEVAYYFCALGIGILGGLDGPVLPTLGFMSLILGVMAFGDLPRLFRSHQRQVITLDSAITDRVALTARLEQLLGAQVSSVNIQRVDLVNDTTMVEVRYREGESDRLLRPVAPSHTARP